MQTKSIFKIISVIAIVWLGCMAWLSGYKQGYSEGSETAWSDARSALMKPLPTMHIETVDLTSTDR